MSFRSDSAVLGLSHGHFFVVKSSTKLVSCNLVTKASKAALKLEL